MPEHVNEGALVKAIYVEMWLTQASSSVGSFTAAVYKAPRGVAATFAEMAALHDYANKKNILYTTQGLSPANTVTILPILKFWVKIPKGKQRMGLGDKMFLSIRNNNGTDDINFCGMSVYKDYR